MVAYNILMVIVLVATTQAQQHLKPSEKLVIGDNGWPPSYQTLEDYEDAANDSFKWTPDYASTEGKSGFLYVNDETFPTLAEGLANGGFAVTYLEPCTVDQLHQHPFASELMYLTKGKIEFGLVNPVTKTSIVGEANAGDFFWTPPDVFQFQANYECERAEFLSVFNKAKIGRIDVVDMFYSTVDSRLSKNSLNLNQKQYNQITTPSLDKITLIEKISPDQYAACRKRCGLD